MNLEKRAGEEEGCRGGGGEITFFLPAGHWREAEGGHADVEHPENGGLIRSEALPHLADRVVRYYLYHPPVQPAPCSTV